MPGTVRVGRPNRIRHIPLSWPVAKARSNHQPKFRPVGDAKLRGREQSVGRVMEEMFSAMPSPEGWINGRMTSGEYLTRAKRVAEPYVTEIAEILQPTFNEAAIMGQDRIRASVNEQLKRLGSRLRLTDAKGEVTKRRRVEEVGIEHLERHPQSRWAPIGEEAFDTVNAASVEYAEFRSGTLVTGMLEEQQRVVRDLIGESFTTAQTFETGRSVVGLTSQQTASALLEMLDEMSPSTPLARNLASFRGVNAHGLTHPWERAVARFAEREADALAARGITGAKAYGKVQAKSQRYANKLRRSRSRMISRTEIKRAQVQGQLSSMRQAVDDGLADPRTAGKKWITGATDVCPMCSDLGFSKAILLDQSFHGVGDGPPAHPNCRCDLDFTHDIKTAPIPRGAGDPNFRPGTPENPITWEFPSGFKTQPSITTTFKPPGWKPPPSIPITPQPPTVQAPAGQKPGPQAAYDDPPPLPSANKPSSPHTVADDINYPNSKQYREAVTPVVQRLDEVLVPPAPIRGKTTNILIKKKKPGKHGPEGTFGPFKSGPKPRRPSYPTRPSRYFRDADTGERYLLPEDEYARLVIKYEDDVAKYNQAIEDWKIRYDAWLDDEGVAQITIQDDPSKMKSLGFRQNTFAHEYGHRLDIVVDPDATSVWTGTTFRTDDMMRVARKIVKDGGAADVLSIPVSAMPAEHQVLWGFFLEATNSPAARRIIQYHMARARAYPSLGADVLQRLEEQAQYYIDYCLGADELWARAFNQWFATRHGTAVMIEDMAIQASGSMATSAGPGEAIWNGFQWRQDEFDEIIAPLVEKILRARGNIL